jgi:hypothetical protein
LAPEQFRAQIAQEIAQWKPLIGEIMAKNWKARIAEEANSARCEWRVASRGEARSVLPRYSLLATLNRAASSSDQS